MADEGEFQRDVLSPKPGMGRVLKFRKTRFGLSLRHSSEFVPDAGNVFSRDLAREIVLGLFISKLRIDLDKGTVGFFLTTDSQFNVSDVLLGPLRF
jgi:hypothetical protein